MNLFEKLPDTLEVNGIDYKIVTDFREWIRVSTIIMSKELEPSEKLMLLCGIFKEEIVLQSEEDVQSMFRAISDFLKGCFNEKERSDKQSQHTAYDFEVDYMYIITDFQREYNIDLINIGYLHWWHFKMLFDNLSDKSDMKQRIYYRTVDTAEIKDQDRKKEIRKIRRKLNLDTVSDSDIANVFD